MEYYGTSFWAPTNTLVHYGVKGMKWGVRRYQNPDGSFNAAGKRRYFSNGSGENYKPVKSAGGNVRRAMAKVYESNEKYYSKRGNNRMASMNKQIKNSLLKEAAEADSRKEKQINDKTSEKAKALRKERLKKAAKVGAIAAGTALAIYGGYKLNQALNKNVSAHYQSLGQSYFEKYAKIKLRADGLDMGGYISPNSGISTSESSSMLRSLANENFNRHQNYRQLARKNSYSTREKLDVAKRIIKGIT